MMMQRAVILALVLALAACTPKKTPERPQAPQAASEQSKAFMAKTAKEAGVIVLPSGLAYKIVRPGLTGGL